jgi:predicted  nucleic acid-binding Zn-ribbon protein
MASRENQGLQAFIIILTILSIGLLVGLVLQRNAWKTQLATATQAQADATKARGDAATAQAETSALKELTGFSPEQTIEQIRETFEADMTKWAQGVPAESRQYRTVLGSTYDEKEKLAANVSAANEEMKKLKASLLAVENEKEAQVKKFQAEMEQIRADAAGQREKFDEDYARINGEKDDIQKQMDELRAEHDSAMTKLEGEKTQLENQIAKLEQSIDKLRLGVPNPDQFAQPADGRVTGVSQRYATVYLDLGSADGLRPQVTFAVAEAGLEDAAAAEQKGSIEVTKIVGPHMAEARITSDSATNPIMPGDRVFSQVWDRGRQVGIGIAGFVDLDKDRKSDLEMLKSIVAASGGVVDAAPDETGKKQGSLKVSTRYLVLGDYPNASNMGELKTSWNDLTQEAESLGIKTIALDEFLSLMGWQVESRSIVMGAGARAEDFPPEPLGEPMPRRPGKAGGAFAPRLPKSTY